MSFLTMRHGQFALPIIQYWKPHQVQPFFGQDVLFNIPFVADWHKIGEHRQSLTHHCNHHKNIWCIDNDYKVGDIVLVMKEGILHKEESKYGKELWAITTVNTNGTIRIQCRTRTERLNIRRVIPFADKIILYIRKNIHVRTVNSIPLSPTLTKSCPFYSNTILTSYMTTQIMMVYFFPY